MAKGEAGRGKDAGRSHDPISPKRVLWSMDLLNLISTGSMQSKWSMTKMVPKCAILVYSHGIF